MSIYGFTGADVHQDPNTNNEILFQAVLGITAQFGNSLVYIAVWMLILTRCLPKQFRKPISHNDGLMFVTSFPRSNNCSLNLFVLIKEIFKADISITFLRNLQQFLPFLLFTWTMMFQYVHIVLWSFKFQL